MNENKDNITFIGNYAAALSMVEIGLGSLLHSLKIPMSGQFLSLNQGFILTLASKNAKSLNYSILIPSHISSVTSLLKSLSPAGKKLTPMLAIAAQGQLFTSGQFILGQNILGHFLGVLLLSLWSFVQPFLLYLLIFGKDLIFMSEYFVRKLSKVLYIDPDFIWGALVGFILLKLLLGLIVVILAHKLPQESVMRYFEWISRYKGKSVKKGSIGPLKGTIKDLCSPLFIVSLVFSGVYLYFAKSSNSQLIWALLRPLAVAFIIFYVIRVFPVEKLSNRLKGGRFSKLSSALDVALNKISKD